MDKERSESDQATTFTRVANREMLAIARESRRLNQDELAQRIGVSQGTISKAECGPREPTEDLVAAYAKELRYPASFFYEVVPTTRLPVVFYRKKKRLDVRHLKAIDAQMRVLRLHLIKLLRSVEAPPLRLPFVDLRAERLSASDVAHDLRLAWNVRRGPIENMTKLAESRGCFVIGWHFDTPDVDALSMHVDGLPPIIAVEPSMPGDRMRFTVAHELAHIILHHHLPLPGGDLESEADEFAAELLMPRDEIRPFLNGLTLDRLAQLKAHWRTSMQAILKRASDLDTISESHARKLWATMSHLGFRRSEPGPVPPEEPTLPKSLVNFHMRRLGYTPAEVAAMVSAEEEEFTKTYLGASINRGLRVVKW